jgi:hypothetical protein
MKWVLIVWVASDLWTALAAYDSEDACYVALEALQREAGTRMACLKGEVEKSKPKSNNRRIKWLKYL